MTLLAITDHLPDPTSASSIGWLMVAVAALAATINQILKLTDRFKANPPTHTVFATKADHGELKERVNLVETRVDENFKLLDQKRSVSIGNLHEALKQQTEMLNGRIDEVPGRVIRLLNETKQLHK